MSGFSSDEDDMNTWSSSVEDPEKHFLGNLLDDETSFSTSPVSRSLSNRSSDIPASSVISGVGSVDCSVQNFWPEPPPPYSASDSSSSSWLHKNNSSFHYNDVLTTNKIKEPQEWETLLGSSFLNQYQSPPQSFIGHLSHPQHQNLYQLNHVEQVRHCAPNNSDLPPSLDFPHPFSFVVSRKKDHAKPPPHSAPVVNKMPFSYRDVAARNETPTSGHSPSQQAQKTISTIENDLSRSSGLSSLETSFERSGNSGQSHRDNKPKAVEEFQKISRKRNGKEKKVIPDSASMPLLNKPNVEEPTKYHVLEKLVIPSPKIIAVGGENENREDSDLAKTRLLSSNVRSRSTSICPEEESSRSRSLKVENKKRSSTQSKKRGLRKKEDEGFSKLATIAWAYVLCACEQFQNACEWLMSLIIDVSSNMFDVFLLSCFCYKLEFTIRCYMLACAAWISESMWRLRNFCRKPQNAGTESIGCEESIKVSTNAAEEVFRISRVRNIDAYSILGLRLDCSDEEIRRNYKKLANVLNANYTNGGHDKVEGIEYARKMVSEAYLAIQNAPSRANYDYEVQMSNSEVQMDLQHMFKALTTHVDMKNNSLKCDCGQRHLRTRTDIRPLEARYCRRCACYHSARNNDIWVETSLFGLVWHYYSCSDGLVYDITEWATCDSNYLKHLRPYSHNVQYRLSNPDSVTEQSVGEEVEEARTCVQASYRPPEHKEEDRSRRAANRRQKRR
ncbi:unnamed protein product [Auanema sp. JU1783]|nr:unnamed protein product [Auanema sp. JU1783]